MKGKLGGLQEGTDDEEEGAQAKARGAFALGTEDFGRSENPRKFPCSKTVPDDNEGADERGVSEAANEEFFACREHGGRPIRVEG